MKGKPVEPETTYTVATPEYLYRVGSNSPSERLDPKPLETGWWAQTLVIE